MTQEQTVVRLLVEAGARGVSAYELVYVHGITRGAAVIHSLRDEGYLIQTLDDGKLDEGKRSLARYVLTGKRVPGSTELIPIRQLGPQGRQTVPPPEPEPFVAPLPAGQGYPAWKALRDTLFGAHETPEEREERVRKSLHG